MNRGQTDRATPRPAEAAAMEVRNLTPGFPSGTMPTFARSGFPSKAEQLADLMALADGWNFRLLV